MLRRKLRVQPGRVVLSTPNSRQQKAPKTRTKKTLPTYLQRSGTDAASDPNQEIWFFKFPLELLEHIASYLPLESVICLTLTCKLALHSLGTSCWKDERVRKRWYVDPVTNLLPRTLFLELLRRDVEGLGLQFCKACNTLYTPLKRPSEHRQTKLTKYCWGQCAIIDYLPRSEDGLGYSLVFSHIKHALMSTPSDSDSPIDYLSGYFRVPHPYLDYSVSSSARYIGDNLILRHEYCFSRSDRVSLRTVDILGLPFRICPHQSTTTEPPPENRYTTDSNPNGPLFTSSIASAFPISRRIGVPKHKVFRKPRPLEQQLMDSAVTGEDVIFRCRSCPTKWKVEYQGGGDRNGGELTVTAFHCFPKDLWSAARSWSWFVRREGEMLGEGKRNSEFWSPGRSYSDFRIE